jgi:hypothetical protein
MSPDGLEPFFAMMVQTELDNFEGDKAIRNGYCTGGVGIGSVDLGRALAAELNAPGGFGLGVWVGDVSNGGKGVYCAARVSLRVASGHRLLNGRF